VCPVVASQIRTVPSRPAEASLPSQLAATAKMPSRWPRKVCVRGTGGAAAGQAAVRATLAARARVAGRDMDSLLGFRVFLEPDANAWGGPLLPCSRVEEG